MQARCAAFSAPTAYRLSHVHDGLHSTHRLACPRSSIVEKPFGEDALRASALAPPQCTHLERNGYHSSRARDCPRGYA